MISNKALARKLTATYESQFTSTQNRQFGLPKSKIGSNEWKFRRLITNVLVGGSNEDNVLVAVELIFAKYSNANGIATATVPALVKIMNANHVRFSTNKAKNIIKIANTIFLDHKGTVPSDRAILEAMPGVGRHVASTVRSLAFGMSAMSVDLHVRRIAKRIGLVDDKASDLKIENVLSKDVDSDLLSAYSRAFVEFGKATCSHTPQCGDCPIKSQCATGSGVVTTPVKITVRAKTAVDVKEGRYAVVAGSSDKEYYVTVKASGISCNCKGYRFRRTCSHITEIAA